MSATLELFEDWKKAKGYATDSAAGDALKVSKQTVNNWRSRGGNGEAHIIERMAADLGRDPIPYVLQAFSEASKSADARRSLGRMARSLGAACLALALLPLSLPQRAEAIEIGNSIISRHIHYAKWITAMVRRSMGRCADFWESSPCSPLASPPARS